MFAIVYVMWMYAIGQTLSHVLKYNTDGPSISFQSKILIYMIVEWIWREHRKIFLFRFGLSYFMKFSNENILLYSL